MPFLKQAAVYCCVLVFFLGLSVSLKAQQTEVTVRVTTASGQALPFATITVVPLPDSSARLQKITDSSGRVFFSLPAGSRYRIQVSAVNFKPVERGITVTANPSLFTIIAEGITKTLNTVTLTSTRPVMRQEDDKTIVDPENLAATSTNAYEIIEKTPGLFVDGDGNIYLSSTTPATIYINGREQKMSTADVATMLKSLPPSAIASIEILRTPSARYDASGSGGIVNVVLKKGVRLGFTGSLNTGFNQGRYGNRFIGLNLNNNARALSTYLNLQYSYRNSYERIKTDRIFAADSVLSQDAFTYYPANTYYLGYGAGYELSRKWAISYDGRFSFNNSRNNSTNNSGIQKISTAEPVTSNETFVQNKGTSNSFTQGLSLKYKADSLGSEWTTDISCTYAPNNTGQSFTTRFTRPLLLPSAGDGDITNKLYFLSAQTSVLKKLPKQLTLEAGLKTTAVTFRNSTDYFRQSGATRVKDNVRTGAYRYEEHINAAYLQVSKTVRSVTVKGGTRLENTAMRGVQVLPLDTSFTLRRTDLFPYVYISRNITKIAGYPLRAYLVYRRSISRPAYEYLNPSVRYIDQYLLETGNPALRPQFTKNYEANISVDERPVFAVGYNDTKDIFTQVVYPADTGRSLAYRTYDNLGSNRETYFRALGAIPPGKRYFFVIGVQYNHNFYRGLYQNKPLRFKRGSWSVFSYQTLKLSPLTQVTLNGFVRFNGQLQFYELSTFGSLNLSINQQFLNKKLVATLSANDVFFTNNNKFILQQATVNASGFRQSDTRRFGLNLRYNFGFRKKEEAALFNLDSPERSN